MHIAQLYYYALVFFCTLITILINRKYQVLNNLSLVLLQATVELTFELIWKGHLKLKGLLKDFFGTIGQNKMFLNDIFNFLYGFFGIFKKK